MALPSPAADYAEQTLTPDLVMGITASSVVIPTNEGYAVAEPGIAPAPGDTALLDVSGELMFAEVGHRRFVTNQMIIEGAALDNARVIGVVTYFIKSFDMSGQR